jgi:hypothetical protein
LEFESSFQRWAEVCGSEEPIEGEEEGVKG